MHAKHAVPHALHTGGSELYQSLGPPRAPWRRGFELDASLAMRRGSLPPTNSTGMQSTRFAVYQKSARTRVSASGTRAPRARSAGARATRELLRAFGIVASSPCRTAARHGSHRHTSWWRASTFAAGGTERPRWNPQRAHNAAALPPCVRVSSLTDARGDFDGLVPLLVEKIARSIRAVDGRRPVAVVTSPNDRDVLGMTLRRLADRPPWRGASSRHRRREANGSTEYNDASDDDAPTRVFTAMDATLGPHRHGEHASSFAVDAHAAMTTQLAATRKRRSRTTPIFAGDVDVDEIALRCAKRDWDPGDLEHGESSTMGHERGASPVPTFHPRVPTFHRPRSAPSSSRGTGRGDSILSTVPLITGTSRE